eukprot:TRINITY_DN1002_c0_g1_i2.p1 TRINITY_DN1002_c0_g1~~TRINITY_DN1002_c0_g1_i2.p1  ORF type:complete len:1300 (+),score=469.77 TRINITY_DN1002_c0_g1_i2:61-3960(+)
MIGSVPPAVEVPVQHDETEVAGGSHPARAALNERVDLIRQSLAALRKAVGDTADSTSAYTAEALQAHLAAVQDAAAALAVWTNETYAACVDEKARAQTEEYVAAVREFATAELDKVNACLAEHGTRGAAGVYLNAAHVAVTEHYLSLAAVLSTPEAVAKHLEPVRSALRVQLDAVAAALGTVKDEKVAIVQAALAPLLVRLSEGLAQLHRWAAACAAPEAAAHAAAAAQAELVRLQDRVAASGLTGAARVYVEDAVVFLKAQASALESAGAAADAVRAGLASRVTEVRTQIRALRDSVEAARAQKAEDAAVVVKAKAAQVEAQLVALNAWAAAVYEARVDEETRGKIEAGVVLARAAVEEELAKVVKVADVIDASRVEYLAVLRVKADEVAAFVASPEAVKAVLDARVASLRAQAAALVEAVRAVKVPTAAEVQVFMRVHVEGLARSAAALNAWAAGKYEASTSEKARAALAAHLAQAQGALYAAFGDVQITLAGADAAVRTRAVAAVATVRGQLLQLHGAAPFPEQMCGALEARAAAVRSQIDGLASVLKELKELKVAEVQAATQPRLEALLESATAFSTWAVAEYEMRVGEQMRVAELVVPKAAALRAEMAKLQERVAAAGLAGAVQVYLKEASTQLTALGSRTSDAACAVVETHIAALRTRTSTLIAHLKAATDGRSAGIPATLITLCTDLHQSLAQLHRWAAACAAPEAAAHAAAAAQAELVRLQDRVAASGLTGAARVYVEDAVVFLKAQASALESAGAAADAVRAGLASRVTEVRTQIRALRDSVEAARAQKAEDAAVVVKAKAAQVEAQLVALNAWAAAVYEARVDEETRGKIEAGVVLARAAVEEELAKVRVQLVGVAGSTRAAFEEAVALLTVRAKAVQWVDLKRLSVAKEDIGARVGALRAQMQALKDDIVAASQAASLDEARSTLSPRFHHVQQSLVEVNEWAIETYTHMVDEDSRERIESAARTVREVVESEVEKLMDLPATACLTQYVEGKRVGLERQAVQLTEYMREKQLASLAGQVAGLREELVYLKEAIATRTETLAKSYDVLEPKVRRLADTVASVHDKARSLLVKYSDSTEVRHQVMTLLGSVRDMLSAGGAPMATFQAFANAPADASALVKEAVEALVAPRAQMMQEQVISRVGECPEGLKHNFAEIKALVGKRDEAMVTRAYLVSVQVFQVILLLASLALSHAWALFTRKAPATPSVAASPAPVTPVVEEVADNDAASLSTSTVTTPEDAPLAATPPPASQSNTEATDAPSSPSPSPSASPLPAYEQEVGDDEASASSA